jgi:hypothetical protein
MVRACEIQAREHFAPAWNLQAPTVKAFKSEKEVPFDWSILTIFDDGDQTRALGWHSESPSGRPYGKVFIRPVFNEGGAMLDGAHSVASVLSHEVLETLADPSVNLWVDGPKRIEGVSYALEVCDPVQGDTYPIIVDGRTVTVSNFVTPNWFDPIPFANSQIDYLGRLKRPFTLAPGGYAVLRHAPGNEKAIYAQTVMAMAAQRARPVHPASRRARRGAWQ